MKWVKCSLEPWRQGTYLLDICMIKKKRGYRPPKAYCSSKVSKLEIISKELQVSRGDPGEPKIYYKIITYVFHVFFNICNHSIIMKLFSIYFVNKGRVKKVYFFRALPNVLYPPTLCLNWNKWIWSFLCLYDHTIPTPNCNLKIF